MLVHRRRPLVDWLTSEQNESWDMPDADFEQLTAVALLEKGKDPDTVRLRKLACA